MNDTTFEHDQTQQLRVTIGRLGISTLVKDGVVNLYADAKKLDSFVEQLKNSGAIPKEKLHLIKRIADPGGETKDDHGRLHKWAANLSYDIPLDAFDMAKLSEMTSHRSTGAAR